MKKLLLCLAFIFLNSYASSPMPAVGMVKDGADFKEVKVEDPTIENVWTTGYQTKIVFKNTSGQQTKSWVVEFELPPGQKVNSLWNGSFAMSGNKVIVTPPAWQGSGDIGIGGEKDIGFVVQKPETGKAEILNLHAKVSTVDSSLIPAGSPAARVSPVAIVVPAVGPFDPSKSKAEPKPSSGALPKPSLLSKTLKIPFVEGYWESWDYSVPLDEIVEMKVDLIDVSFGKFVKFKSKKDVEVGGLSTEIERFTQFIDKAHKAGKKVKIAIGGANYPLNPTVNASLDPVDVPLNSAENVLKMAQAIATFIHQYNLDGIDFDIEDYRSFLPKQMSDYVIDLIAQTRLLLGKDALISFTPMAPAYAVEPYPTIMKAAHPYLTSISIMAYNAYPTYDYQDDVNRLIAMGIPANKIVVGLMPGNDDTRVVTSLDKIRQASNFVKKQGLAGIMFWSMNRDHAKTGSHNATSLGVDAATNAAWEILHER